MASIFIKQSAIQPIPDWSLYHTHLNTFHTSVAAISFLLPFLAATITEESVMCDPFWPLCTAHGF